MNVLGNRCDDFCLTCDLNTQLDLPRSRDTVLHFFEQVGKAYPGMVNFSCREGGDYVLEEDKEVGSYRWVSLEARRVTSGFLNPSSLDDCHPQHELVLDLAPHLLSVNALDCEALDVTFAFDFHHKGNHNEVVAAVFAADPRLQGMLAIPNARLVNVEPNITLALDEECRMQCRLSAVPRTGAYQVRTSQFGEESLSIYFSVRQFWDASLGANFIQSYRHQVDIGLELVNNHVIPNILVPISEAIAAD